MGLPPGAMLAPDGKGSYNVVPLGSDLGRPVAVADGKGGWTSFQVAGGLAGATAGDAAALSGSDAVPPAAGGCCGGAPFGVQPVVAKAQPACFTTYERSHPKEEQESTLRGILYAAVLKLFVSVAAAVVTLTVIDTIASGVVSCLVVRLWRAHRRAGTTKSMITMRKRLVTNGFKRVLSYLLVAEFVMLVASGSIFATLGLGAGRQLSEIAADSNDWARDRSRGIATTAVAMCDGGPCELMDSVTTYIYTATIITLVGAVVQLALTVRMECKRQRLVQVDVQLGAAVQELAALEPEPGSTYLAMRMPDGKLVPLAAGALPASSATTTGGVLPVSDGIYVVADGEGAARRKHKHHHSSTKEGRRGKKRDDDGDSVAAPAVAGGSRKEKRSKKEKKRKRDDDKAAAVAAAAAADRKKTTKKSRHKHLRDKEAMLEGAGGATAPRRADARTRATPASPAALLAPAGSVPAPVMDAALVAAAAALAAATSSDGAKNPITVAPSPSAAGTGVGTVINVRPARRARRAPSSTTESDTDTGTESSSSSSSSSESTSSSSESSSEGDRRKRRHRQGHRK